MKAAFIAWLVSLMVHVAPPAKLVKYSTSPATKETADERFQRYTSIAEGIYEALQDQEIQTPFKGTTATFVEAAVLLGIAHHESGGFSKAVHYGIGLGKPGNNADQGRSWCLTQQLIGTGKTPDWNKVKNRFAYPDDPPTEVSPGWSGKELVAQEAACFRAARRMIAVSYSQCSKNPLREKLTYYAAGNCSSQDGKNKSSIRISTAEELFRLKPLPLQMAVD